ncbi:hypothetical protein B0H11DRAFT_2105598, partial [Mycena galericulata]
LPYVTCTSQMHICVTKVGTRNQRDIPMQSPTAVSVYDGPESLILATLPALPEPLKKSVSATFFKARIPALLPFILLWLGRLQVSQSASTPTSAFVLLQIPGMCPSHSAPQKRRRYRFKQRRRVRRLEGERSQRKGPPRNRVGFLPHGVDRARVCVRFTPVSPLTRLGNSVEVNISRADRTCVTVKTCLSWLLVQTSAASCLYSGCGMSGRRV